MTDAETITVADISDGPGGTTDIDPGTAVSLPVVEILTGRGFVTGKSGSGKSNTASVIIENLLSNNFPVLIVDTDGEYYGLKEAYEILHVGADEECDIQVSPEHAEKIASLALEQNVPIILDVSGYLDDADAQELLLNTARHLFAKEKKLKKPFLLVIEECHEYIPEKGGMGEAGKMLIKIGKRGRKHGLGILGISQRPADVKKDYITQCDWLVWHRLTWGNDTKVVGRILGSEYADAIEDLANGEGFLITDWSESIRRVQFHRKQTFDAGATPGLDDFERPELKSVSGDLVSELREISDEKASRESEFADLRQELEKKRARIEQLEGELADARDLSRMADQFAQALLRRSEAPYRGGAGRNLRRPDEQAELYEYEADATGSRGDERTDADGPTDIITEAEPEGAAVDSTRPNEIPDRLDTVDRRAVTEEAMRFAEAVELGTREAVIDELRERIDGLPSMSLEMLRHYRTVDSSDPLAAHIAAGGDGDNQLAYSRNRPLRQARLIRHTERGEYAYAVPGLIREAYADQLSDEEVETMVRSVESVFIEDGTDPSRGDAADFVLDVDRDSF
ncbi:helicase HerA domain-containing protein [Haloferacaceae archaeon DSL9]